MQPLEPLSTDDLVQALKHLPHWRVHAGQLLAKFMLADFKTVMQVVVQVADVAERLGHHPTWSNTYNQLSFALTTHDAGNQITLMDVELAESISAIVESILPAPANR